MNKYTLLNVMVLMDTYTHMQECGVDTQPSANIFIISKNYIIFVTEHTNNSALLDHLTQRGHFY